MPGEKTEKASPKRRRDERKKGTVVLSREVVTVSSLVSVFFALSLLAPFTITTVLEHIDSYIRLTATQTDLSTSVLRTFFIDGIVAYAMGAMPILIVAILVSTIVTMAQTRMLFSMKALAFKIDRINPLSGFKKMFSIRGLVELVKSLLKIAVLLFILYSVLGDQIALFPRMMDMTILQGLAFAGELIMDVVFQAGIIFAFLAAGDYLFQWWQYEKNLRMSKQEIKDEYKQLEGDPQIKARIRSMQQQRARQRMMQNVPSADVVIRNPTHYAVAIKYEQGKNYAPVVIAKGADALALRIIAVAEEHEVHITENKPLARALFETVEVDREIPQEHYRAIAEILAFVYSLKPKKTKI